MLERKFRFVYFFSTSASARNLSRNACHTSLVESNGATGWRIVILLCKGRHFLLPSWATSRSDGEEGTPSIESKICKHSFRLAQTSASWKPNAFSSSVGHDQSPFSFLFPSFPLLFSPFLNSHSHFKERLGKNRRNRQDESVTNFLQTSLHCSRRSSTIGRSSYEDSDHSSKWYTGEYSLFQNCGILNQTIFLKMTPLLRDLLLKINIPGISQNFCLK